MLPYYILIFSPFLFSLLKSRKILVNKKIYTLGNAQIIGLFFFIYLTMLILRDVSIGRDLINYSSLFKSYLYRDWKNILRLDIEPLYIVLNKIIGMFTSNFQWVIVITSFLIAIPVWITYRKEIEDPLLTISLFIILPTFVMFFSGLRQSIAIALGMIAYEMTKRHKLIPFLLICVLAVGFHYSASVLFLMYPLYRAKITRNWFIISIPVLVMIYVFNKQFFLILTALFGRYESNIRETNAYSMLILFILFAVFSFVIPDEEKIDEETYGMRNFLLLSLAIQLFVPLNSLVMRMNYYYIIFIPLLIPKIIKCCERRWNQVALLSKYVFLLYFLFYFFDHMPSGNILDTFPYRFFWEV